MVDKVKSRLGFETSVLLCHHASMSDIVSAAFGGEKKPEPGKFAEGTTDVGQAATYEMALSQMNNVLKWS